MSNLETGIQAYELGNYTEAFEILLPLAVSGNVQAQSSVAGIYDLGLGVEANRVEAIKWYRLAAEQGHPVAQHNLGELYYEQEQFGKAATWYRKAAEQNFPFALDALGDMYLRGIGVPQDDREAAKLYSKAAGLGFLFAQHNLAEMYVEGRGVDRDFNEAVRLYHLAAEQGYAPSQKVLAEAFQEGLLGLPRDLEKAQYWFGTLKSNIDN